MRRSRWPVGTLGLLVGAVLLAGVVTPAQAADAHTRACTVRDISAGQTSTGAGMSQPWSGIRLVNRSATSCALHGYPTVIRMKTATGTKPITVTYGNMANIAGPAPHYFVLAPGGHAWFAIGAATAYDSPPKTFRKVVFAITGGTKTVHITLPASHPTGKPYPIGVTAYAPGDPPTN